MFELDEETEKRIALICQMDLIGRPIGAAVAQNIASPILRRSTLNKKIPVVALRRLLLSPHLRSGNVPAIFAELTNEYGPVFEIRPPFAKPMTFLAGPEANHWVHRHGRMHLKAGGYFADFERVYGAHGVLPALDGTDHFRLRKAMGPANSRARLAGRLDEVYRLVRQFMATWKAGETFPVRACRRMINAQLSPLFLAVESQDIFDDLTGFKERALTTHIINALPRFMLKTPGMKRRAKSVDTLLERIQSVHTPAQRAGCPRNLADDWLSLHASDPQLVPEANLRFVLSAALVASVYLGDALSFAVYALASQPALCERIQAEADALFENGDPDGEDFNQSSTEVTRRFLMECLRMYPSVPHVLAGRDEFLRARRLRTAGGVEGPYRPDGSALHGRCLPRPLLVRHRPLSASARRAPRPRLRALRTGHAQMPRLALDGPAARGERADDRVSLHPRGVPRGLEAQVQPASVDEAEREAQVPRRRAEARPAGLRRRGRPMARIEASPLFDSSRRDTLVAILGNIEQTMYGRTACKRSANPWRFGRAKPVNRRKNRRSVDCMYPCHPLVGRLHGPTERLRRLGPTRPDWDTGANNESAFGLITNVWEYKMQEAVWM